MARVATFATCQATLMLYSVASLFLFSCVTALPSSSSPLDVGVFAPWPTFSNSILGEAAEFLASEDGETSNTLFWSFHRASMSLASEKDLLTDHAVATRAALEIAEPLVASMSFDVLRLSLETRAYSPALEMVRQIGLASLGYAKCVSQERIGEQTWAEFDGAVACSPAELSALLTKQDSVTPQRAVDAPLLPGDHEFLLGSNSLPLLAVWGSLGGPQASALHDVAAQAASEGRVRYVWRTFLSAGGRFVDEENKGVDAPVDEAALPSPVTWLAGYGVIVDVKSTEYKAVDERTAASAATAGASGSPAAASSSSPLDVTLADPTLPPHWLQGLSDLLGGHSEQAQSLLRFVPVSNVSASVNLAAEDATAIGAGAVPSSVSASASAYAPFSEGPLAPWEMGDLSLQASAYVMDAAVAGIAGASDSEDPLARLLTVTANFPSLARALSRLPVPTHLRAEAQNNSRRMAGAVTAALVSLCMLLGDHFTSTLSRRTH